VAKKPKEAISQSFDGFRTGITKLASNIKQNHSLDEISKIPHILFPKSVPFSKPVVVLIIDTFFKIARKTIKPN
jgi:hypothetical protein